MIQLKDIRLSLLALIIGISTINCTDNAEEPSPTPPFNITDYIIAGTTSPSSNSYKGVYIIKLLEGNKAVMMNTSTDLAGEYKLTQDSLIFVVPDKANYRELRIALGKDHEVLSAQYKALTRKYNTTALLIKKSTTNLLAGQTFMGKEYGMGPKVNKERWYYQFNAAGNKYGTGEDLTTIETDLTPEIIENVAFRSKIKDGAEMGYFDGNQLVVFKYQKLYYFGDFSKQ